MPRRNKQEHHQRFSLTLCVLTFFLGVLLALALGVAPAYAIAATTVIETDTELIISNESLTYSWRIEDGHLIPQELFNAHSNIRIPLQDDSQDFALVVGNLAGDQYSVSSTELVIATLESDVTTGSLRVRFEPFPLEAFASQAEIEPPEETQEEDLTSSPDQTAAEDASSDDASTASNEGDAAIEPSNETTLPEANAEEVLGESQEDAVEPQATAQESQQDPAAQEDTLTEGTPLLSCELLVTLAPEQNYLTTQLVLSVSQPEEVQLLSLSHNSLNLGRSYRARWSMAEKLTDESFSSEGRLAYLGQPVYADSFFFGLEFPAAENYLEDATLHLCYYSGKTFATLEADADSAQRASTPTEQDSPEDFSQSAWYSWPCVIGTAQATTYEAMQASFFDYIARTSRGPASFISLAPQQSDALALSSESLASDIAQFEENATQANIQPLDAYVVKDGWNNYAVSNVPDYTGTSDNLTSFWEFNSKFPNELYSLKEETSLLQSRLGLWFSPRGGTRFNASFSHLLELAQTGEVQAQSLGYDSICVASDIYLSNLEHLLTSYEDKFALSYWDFDGFTTSPCENETHAHMTGGPNAMYYWSDLWEKWAHLLANLRQHAAEHNDTLESVQDVWLNASADMGYSPWALLFLDSLEPPQSEEMQGLAFSGAPRIFKKITAQLGSLKELLEEMQIQLPTWALHTRLQLSENELASLNADDLRQYLFSALTSSGSACTFELAPTALDAEHYQILSDFLSYRQAIQPTLQGAHYTELNENCSLWTQAGTTTSLISVVNTSEEPQELNVAVALFTNMLDATANLVASCLAGGQTSINMTHTLEPNQNWTLTLEPYEVQTWLIAAEPQQARLTAAEPVSNTELIARFSQPMAAEAEFLIDAQELTAQLQADRRSYHLSAEGIDLTTEQTHELELIEAYSAQGQALEPQTLAIRTSGSIGKTVTGDWPQGENLEASIVVLDEGQGIAGSQDFSVCLGVTTTASAVELMSQEGEWSLSLDDEGYPVFRVAEQEVIGRAELTSVSEPARGTFGTYANRRASTQTHTSDPINDGSPHSIVCVREKTGVLKLYVDGTLLAATYSEETPTPELSGATVRVGSSEFEGEIIDAHVVNSALNTSEVAAMSNVDTLAPIDANAPLPGGPTRAAVALALATIFCSALIVYRRRTTQRF